MSVPRGKDTLCYSGDPEPYFTLVQPVSELAVDMDDSVVVCRPAKLVSGRVLLLSSSFHTQTVPTV